MERFIRKILGNILALALAAALVSAPVQAEGSGTPQEVREVLLSGRYLILDQEGHDVTQEIRLLVDAGNDTENADALWAAICAHSCSLNWSRITGPARILQESDAAGGTREILVFPVTHSASWSESVSGSGQYYVRTDLSADIRVNGSTNTIIAIENAAVQIGLFWGYSNYTGASLAVQDLSGEIASGKAYVTTRYYLDLALNSGTTVRRGQYYDAMIVNAQGTITFETHHDLSN